MLKDIILERMKLYEEISKKDKEKIFIAAIKNDVRYENNKDILKIINNVKTMEQLQQQLEKFFNVENVKYYKKITNIENFIKYVKLKAIKIANNEFLQTVFINYLLCKNNLCPILNFAFDEWYYRKKYSESLFINQVDLSTTYLYRLVELKKEDKSFSKGAYSYINIDYKHKIVQKIPRNFAAKMFANEDEYKTMLCLSKTELRYNIPKVINFDIETGIIKKEYILGILGHEMLERKLLNKEIIQKLKDLYENIINITQRLDIKLDIHPSNFIWSEKFKRWFLIDLGIVPEIAYKYYPQNFEEYFKKVWLERLERMKKFPIRSVYI